MGRGTLPGDQPEKSPLLAEDDDPDKILRRPSLRSQLNQIRLWVRQGRTDAWIAHKLDISVGQLEQFKRDHGLDPNAAPAPEPVAVPEPPRIADADDLDREEDEDEAERPPRRRRRRRSEEAPERDDDETEAEAPRRRRRGRRGGRRRSSRRPVSYEATFDHGEEGYGLWLDPAVADNPIYEEHWAGHRAVAVVLEPDAITIRRADTDGDTGGARADEEPRRRRVVSEEDEERPREREYPDFDDDDDDL
jgi:hypothetical protein